MPVDPTILKLTVTAMVADFQPRYFQFLVPMLVGVFGLLLPSAGVAQDAGKSDESAAVEWTAADTKLANHYIQLLQAKPEYGSVLDLLWGLYDKKGQKELLLEYIGGAASAEDAEPVAQLIFGHLLRKNEDAESALEFYEKVLESDPENAIALRGAAELTDVAGRVTEAIKYYDRARAAFPIETEAGVAVRLRLAALKKEADAVEESVKIWNALLAAYPGNVQLRTEVVSLLLEAGETASAIRVLKELAANSPGQDPQQRLDALVELNRLYEFINDFDGADAAAREALGLVHFKNHRHEDLFRRLVRLYERFEKLDVLKAELEKIARQENPSEEAVYRMAEFCRQTADAVGEEKWTKRLSELVPRDVDYQIQLATIQMENDRYDEAAVVLDRLLAENPQAPLRFTLLRSRVALNNGGRDSAESVLRGFLEARNPDSETRREILDFAREHYLDGIVEEMLRGRMADPANETAPTQLAKFLQERSRPKQAIETLEKYVSSAGEANSDKARRLHEVSLAYRDMDLLDQALEKIQEAISLLPNQSSFHLTKAEIHMDRKEIPQATKSFEVVRDFAEGLEGKSEIDQRLFSLLRGIVEEKPEEEVDPAAAGVIQNLQQYRQMAAAASRGNRESEEPPPKQLVDYFREIVETANEEATVEARYRAGWWAFKMQDTQECFAQLTKAQAEADKPVKEVEKLLLAMAVQMERPTLQARHLETLAKIDPDNSAEYLQKRAEVRFILGYEDEAIRTLKKLAAKPDASLDTLRTLAKAYQRLGSENRQAEVWRDAYQRGNIFEKRQIIKQLTQALIDQKKPEEALKIQSDLISRETDLIQKRKQFDTQLTLANQYKLVPWLRENYEALARKEPFERFYPEALAKIYRATDDPQKSFEAMKKAYYMSGHDRDLLIQLGELAGQSNDLKSAIYYRRQLIAHGEEGENLESWVALAKMLETDLRIEEADLIRKRLESKFGQEADFLQELAGHYYESGQIESAIRVHQKIFDLRPWDVRNALALGLVQNDFGNQAAALEAFESILKQTESTSRRSYEQETGGELTLFPVTRGGYKKEGPLPVDRGIRPMQEWADSFPFLTKAVSDDLIDWFAESHPEFDRLPRKENLIRLRAIEEIGRISRSNPARSAEWIARWKAADSASKTEKLWAFHHGGAGPELMGFLTPVLGNSNSIIHRVWYNYFGVVHDQTDVIQEWAQQDEDAVGMIREQYPVLAVFLEIAEAPPGFHLPEERDSLLSALSFAGNLGPQLFNRLREEGDLEAALRLGKKFADNTENKTGNFEYLVSSVAGQLGYEEERMLWLERAIESMQSAATTSIPSFFGAAVTEYVSLMESVEQKREFASGLFQWVETSPVMQMQLQNYSTVLLHQLFNQTDLAIDAMPALWEGTISQTLRIQNDVDQDTEGFRWNLLYSYLNTFSRSLNLSPVQADAYFETTGIGTNDALISDIAMGRFQDYQNERLARYFEALDPPAREIPFLQIYREAPDPQSKISLAQTLDLFGFRQEAMRIYREGIETNRNDYSFLRGFFDAALAAKDPEPALDVIETYLTQSISLPAGIGADDLRKFHSEFLFLNRDVDRLEQITEAYKNVPPGQQSLSTLSYQAALARTYEKTGDRNSLLKLLSHLRQNGTASKAQILKGARLILESEDFVSALEWLEDVELNQTDVPAEKEIIREMTALMSDSEKLAKLARISRDYHDPELTIDVANALQKSGALGKATSALQLHARTKNLPSTERFRLLEAAFRQQVESQPDVDFDKQAGDSLSQLLAALTPETAASENWAMLLNDHADKAWLPYLEPHLARQDSKLGAWLATCRINGDAFDFDTALSFSPVEAPRMLESLLHYGESGKNLARRLTQNWESHATRRSFFGDPSRQIAFFASIEDKIRLAEIQSRLLLETESDRFYQTSQAPGVPNFANRKDLPRQLAELGYAEFAHALYRRYHESIRRITTSKAPFVVDYARFLIEKKDYPQAGRILKPVFRKSTGADLSVIAELALARDEMEQLDSLADRFFLSKGQKIELEEIRRGLAEREKLPDSFGRH